MSIGPFGSICVDRPVRKRTHRHARNSFRHTLTLEAVVKGERFRVLEDHAIAGLSQWRAPVTGSFECILPAGLLLVCSNEQKPGAVGFSCVPEDYESGERLLVPKEDREHPKYDGYYFVLMEAEMGTWFDRAS